MTGNLIPACSQGPINCAKKKAAFAGMTATVLSDEDRGQALISLEFGACPRIAKQTLDSRFRGNDGQGADGQGAGPFFSCVGVI